MISNTFSWNGILNAALIIISAFSIFLATRNTIKKSVTDIQKEVIGAQAEQIKALQDRVGETERRNAILLSNQDTIIAALAHRGIRITIDGDLVTVADGLGTETSRKRPPPQAHIVEKEK